MQYLVAVWFLLTLTFANGAPTDTSIPRKRQQPKLIDSSEKDVCDFGSFPEVNFCSWMSSNISELRWKGGSGKTTFWLGGPTLDHSGQQTGGYVFVDTLSSQSVPFLASNGSAFLVSTNLSQPTDPEGLCLQFWYSLSGLSADSLRILLISGDSNLLNPKQVLWESKDQTILTEEGKLKTEWLRGQVLFNQRAPYKIAFEAVTKPVDSSGNFRGHIALDDVVFLSPVLSPGIGCKGFCSFEGGLCEWENDNEDDFDWQLGKGSNSRLTGPSTDHGSQVNGGEPGAYLYIDTSYSRSPDDKARLLSAIFDVSPYAQPICLKFWTHMFGSGIGSLNVYVRQEDEDKKVWQMSGDTGNQWHNAQMTIVANSTFQVIFEGVVGRNPLGNIAIDDITFQDGPCAGQPPSAVGRQADCTFESDDCFWINVDAPDEDQFDWIRFTPLQENALNPNPPVNLHQVEPLTDHTTGQNSGYFITLDRSKTANRNGDKANYISPLFKASTTACLSLWVYLHERTADVMDPGLGTLRIYIQPVNQSDSILGIPVWRLTNYDAPTWFKAETPIQYMDDYRVIIEGTLGPSRQGIIAVDDIVVYDDPNCEVKPKRAIVRTGECSFDKNFCNWKNPNISLATQNHWQLATPMRRPNNIKDHTYQAQVGYIFFDIYNPNGGMSVRLESPELRKDPDSIQSVICLSFWFWAIGNSSATQLQVFVEESEEDTIVNERKIWRIRMSDISVSKFEWILGQVSVPITDQYKVVFEGTSSNGGFAVDDIGFLPGECPTRPIESADFEIADNEFETSNETDCEEISDSISETVLLITTTATMISTEPKTDTEIPITTVTPFTSILPTTADNPILPLVNITFDSPTASINIPTTKTKTDTTSPTDCITHIAFIDYDQLLSLIFKPELQTAFKTIITHNRNLDSKVNISIKTCQTSPPEIITIDTTFSSIEKDISVADSPSTTADTLNNVTLSTNDSNPSIADTLFTNDDIPLVVTTSSTTDNILSVAATPSSANDTVSIASTPTIDKIIQDNCSVIASSSVTVDTAITITPPTNGSSPSVAATSSSTEDVVSITAIPTIESIIQDKSSAIANSSTNIDISIANTPFTSASNSSVSATSSISDSISLINSISLIDSTISLVIQDNLSVIVTPSSINDVLLIATTPTIENIFQDNSSSIVSSFTNIDTSVTDSPSTSVTNSSVSAAPSTSDSNSLINAIPSINSVAAISLVIEDNPSFTATVFTDDTLSIATTPTIDSIFQDNSSAIAGSSINVDTSTTAATSTNISSPAVAAIPSSSDDTPLIFAISSTVDTTPSFTATVSNDDTLSVVATPSIKNILSIASTPTIKNIIQDNSSTIDSSSPTVDTSITVIPSTNEITPSVAATSSIKVSITATHAIDSIIQDNPSVTAIPSITDSINTPSNNISTSITDDMALNASTLTTNNSLGIISSTFQDNPSIINDKTLIISTISKTDDILSVAATSTMESISSVVSISSIIQNNPSDILN